MSQRKYFGTDGVRGEVGGPVINAAFALRLGYAAGRVLVRRNANRVGGRPQVLIGKDTRISGYMLESALEAGLSAAGIDVLLAGPIPTPGVAYLTRTLRLVAGIVISASHNPYQDNGIKFFSAEGTKLPDDVEAEIEAALDEELGCVRSEELGRARRMSDSQGRYIEFCKSTVPSTLDLRGMKLVIDAANGAAYNIAPHVFREVGPRFMPLVSRRMALTSTRVWVRCIRSPWPPRSRRAVRTTASRSTATPIACRWSTPAVGFITATSCSTPSCAIACNVARSRAWSER
ncbi:phosphoglucomutase/phosphomannomutase, alpha/beta/alpha domain I family protein [Bordetella holmesii 35009]|nr:phosphoglucomutase/phosphomannomutase, alpha/beta/alpha domain I family protein [Bordetella holmesii 35009]